MTHNRPVMIRFTSLAPVLVLGVLTNRPLGLWSLAITSQMLTVWIFISAFALAASEADLAYEVRVSDRQITVDIRFSRADAIPHRIVLPSTYGGDTELAKAISEPEVVEGDVHLKPGERPFLRDLDGGGRNVHLRYVVASAQDPLDRSTLFRAVITPRFFHLLGNAWIVRPDWPQLDQRSVEFTWKVPAGWSIANSFGQGQFKQLVRATPIELTQAVYVAGDFRFQQRIVRGQPLVVAARGDYDLSQYADFAARLIDAQRDFWRDHEFPFYLISLLPVRFPRGAVSGTGRFQGFAAFLSPGAPLDEQVEYLLSHELLHTWIPFRFKLPPDGLSPELFWFSEGFTDYYSYVLLMNSGFMTFEDFTNLVNRKINEYLRNPARNWPNKRAGSEYHKDQHARALAYLRGMLIALNWNAAIRAATDGRSSLSDVVRALRSSADILSESTITHELRRVGLANADTELQRWLRMGETIELGSDALGACAEKVGNSFRVRPDADSRDCGSWFR